LEKINDIIIGIIVNDNEQDFCWIDHLNKIFCYQKEFEESKFSLFSKSGNLIRCVYSLENDVYQVNSVFYNKNNFEVYLNVDKKIYSQNIILILNKEFDHIQTVDHDLTNLDFNFNYSSEITLFNDKYNIFHYNSIIAFIQEKRISNKKC
jgi:hypothetical protein